MRSGTLLVGMTRRNAIAFVRYGFDSISQLVVIFIVFLIIFFGAKTLMAPGPRTGYTQSAILVGFMVWMLGIFAYSNTSFALVEEATTGTLEQLAMSPFGLRRVVVAHFVANLGMQLMMLTVLLTLMMAVSGRWLHIDMISLVPLVLLTIVGVFGLGLCVGGCAIVFKRVQGLLQIVQFLFVGLVAVPLDQVPWFRYLPLAWGNELIRRVMVDGASIAEIPVGDPLFFVVHAAVWVAFGLAVFGRLEHVARERALLGHY